jgi:hypothetical protein
MNKPQIQIQVVREKDSGQEYRVAADSFEDAVEYNLTKIHDYEFIRSEVVDYDNVDVYISIAEALTGNWTAKPISKEYKDCAFYLSRDDGLTLVVNTNTYGLDGKHKFSFSPPRDSKRNVHDIYENGSRLGIPSIKCSTSKTPEKLAKDIERRLLPDCEDQQVKYLERINQAESFYKKEDNIKEVCQSLKGGKGIYFRPNGSSVQVTGYIDPELAQQIQTLLG